MELNQTMRKEFERLKNVLTPQKNDLDLIFSLYKGFVNPNASFYTTGCNCQNSIENVYRELMAWYENNK
jgi:hypothetical protein